MSFNRIFCSYFLIKITTFKTVTHVKSRVLIHLSECVCTADVCSAVYWWRIFAFYYVNSGFNPKKAKLAVFWMESGMLNWFSCTVVISDGFWCCGHVLGSGWPPVVFLRPPSCRRCWTAQTTIMTTTWSSPTSSWMVKRKTSTLLHAASSCRLPAKTSGRSSSCCLHLPCPPAGDPPCLPPTTWRRCLTSWTMTTAPLQHFCNPSSSRIACGAAASPPPQSWRRWCQRGWPRCGPAGTPATLRPSQTEQLTSRWAGLRWALGTCRTSTPRWQTALIPLWCSWVRSRWMMVWRWRWGLSWDWTRHHPAAVTANQVSFILKSQLFNPEYQSHWTLIFSDLSFTSHLPSETSG